MLFEEHPNMKNTHWLTNLPVTSCRKYTVGKTPVLCSGSTMGSREGILDYINVMVVRFFHIGTLLDYNISNILLLVPTLLQEEFDYWKTRQECRVELKGDVSISKCILEYLIIPIAHTSNLYL